MNNRNFLVTSVAAKVQLVKSLKESCDLYNVKLIGSDLHKNCAALYFAHHFIFLPRLDDALYLSKLLTACKENNVGYIIPTRDEDLCYFSKHDEELKKNNIIVCQSPQDTINICSNKNSFRTFCEDNYFSVPKRYLCSQNTVYPCVVKLPYSSASNGVFIVKNQLELKKITERYQLENLIIEEFIPYKEYSIDAFFDTKGHFINAVARERILVSGGEAKISKTIKNDFLVKLTQDLGKKLTFIGHIVIQVFYHDSMYYLVEINPRFGGASNLSIKAGLDSPNKLISMMLGNESELSKKGVICYNLTMLRYSEDLFVNE